MCLLKSFRIEIRSALESTSAAGIKSSSGYRLKDCFQSNLKLFVVFRHRFSSDSRISGPRLKALESAVALLPNSSPEDAGKAGCLAASPLQHGLMAEKKTDGVGCKDPGVIGRRMQGCQQAELQHGSQHTGETLRAFGSTACTNTVAASRDQSLELQGLLQVAESSMFDQHGLLLCRGDL